jgi:subtilase family serine protease
MAPAGFDGRLAAPAGQYGGEGFKCQKPGAEFECYGPHQIRRAYEFSSLLAEGKDGRGRTIVIIDAFQDPTLSTDLASFDSVFKLPAPSGLEVVAPFGLTPFEPSDHTQVGWSSEIALDVEWAHAIAPGAKLVLALAPTNKGPDILKTERYVVEHNLGDVISMSYGETEECEPPAQIEEEHAIFRKAVDHGTTPFAAAGDTGSAELNCEETAFLPNPAVEVPASDPNVTAVGGTKLIAKLTSGAYESESVWSEPEEKVAGGGGFSSLYASPDYQHGVKGIGSHRGIPDVTYSAAAHGGAIVAWGSSGEPGEFWVFSGTSVGTPQWAALTAIADQVAQRRLGNINPALYAIGQGKRAVVAFHDITVGNNSFQSVPGYAATTGWDAASGWGSPKARNLVSKLASSQAENGDQSNAGQGEQNQARPRRPSVEKAHTVKPLGGAVAGPRAVR